MPEYGTFNLHASLLPNYRGAAPINWAIINGETKTGVSTFFIDEKIDTGDMILQETIKIEPGENAGSLHDKLMEMGSTLVLKTVSLIEKGNVKTIPQKEIKDIKTAYKLNKDNCKINWNDSIDHIYNHIRGLSPYPAAWCTLINGEDELDVKIYEVEKELITHNLKTGLIISTKKELKVSVAKGYIIIKELKLPGKRTMDVKSLLNGYTFEANAKMP
jgi:methionyl-tRNA formyltransferase